MDTKLEEVNKVYDKYSCDAGDCGYCCWSCLLPPCANAMIIELISSEEMSVEKVNFEELSYCHLPNCYVEGCLGLVLDRFCCCVACSIITRRRVFTKRTTIEEFKKETRLQRCKENCNNCCEWPFWFRVALCPCCIIGAEKKYIDTLPNNKATKSGSAYTQVSMSEFTVPPGERFSII
jgi:hypothetical protein